MLDYFVKVIGMVLPVLFLSCVFVYVAVQLFKHSLSLLKHVESNKRVNLLLKGTLSKTSGDRLIVMKFHGVNHNMDVIEYNFMSCVFEAYKKGGLPLKKILSKIPAASYVMFLKNLRDGYVILDPRQVHNEISEASCDHELVQNETKGLFIMLNNKDAKPSGYIALKKNEDFANEDLQTITKLADELAEVIS